jgi:hypothetical protein
MPLWNDPPILDLNTFWGSVRRSGLELPEFPENMPLFGYDWSPRIQRKWSTRRAEVASPFIVKEFLERPHLLVRLMIILTAILIIARTAPRLCKMSLFWMILITSFMVRCMGYFSGELHYHKSGWIWTQFLPWYSASPYKFACLLWINQLGVWNYSYLGVFTRPGDDIPASEAADTIKPPTDFPEMNPTPSLQVGATEASSLPVSTAQPSLVADSMIEVEPASHDTADDDRTIKLPLWSCLGYSTLRMAYYHIIDNTLHLVWLRYFWPFGKGQPYTEYVNNSELLHLSLLFLVIAWTCIRAREMHLMKEKDLEKGPVLLRPVNSGKY